jgi:hypothetical protein
VEEFTFYSGYGTPSWTPEQACSAIQALKSAYPNASWGSYIGDDLLRGEAAYFEQLPPNATVLETMNDLFENCTRTGGMPYAGPVIQDVLHTSSTDMMVTFQESQEFAVNYVVDPTNTSNSVFSAGSSVESSGIFGMSPSSEFAKQAGITNMIIAQSAKKAFFNQAVPTELFWQSDDGYDTPEMAELATGMDVDGVNHLDAYNYWKVQVVGFKVGPDTSLNAKLAALNCTSTKKGMAGGQALVDSGSGALGFPAAICEIMKTSDDDSNTDNSSITYSLRTSDGSTRNFTLELSADVSYSCGDSWVLGKPFYDQMVVSHSYETRRLSVAQAVPNVIKTNLGTAHARTTVNSRRNPLQPVHPPPSTETQASWFQEQEKLCLYKLKLTLT